jgi:hypothetical protein
MWGEYADNHKGACLIFDRKLLSFKNPNPLRINGKVRLTIGDAVGPEEVKYVESYINEDPTARELTVWSFLTTKFSCWKHEQEYRFIAGTQENYRYPEESLVGVVFGLRTETATISAVSELLSRLYSRVKLYQVVLAPGAFEFEVKELEIADIS